MAELPKRYDPKAVEPKRYQRWIQDRDFVAYPKGYPRGIHAPHFMPNAKSSNPPFSIVMPPPNVTGVLTLGHVLNDTIQDILVRRGPLEGFAGSWGPGTHPAG